MIRLEVYINDEELKIHLFNDETNENYFVRGNDAYRIIRVLYDHRMIDIYENKPNVLFKFDQCEVNINEYLKIFESTKLKELFTPIFTKAEKIIETSNVRKLKKKKVVRKNKHKGVEILVAGLAALLIINSSVKALTPEKIDYEVEQYVTITPDSNEIDDETKDVISVNRSPEEEDYTVQIELNNNDQEESYTTSIELDDNDQEESYTTSIELDDTGNENNQAISISYDDRTEVSKAISTNANYGSVIEKYSKTYGVDPKLMIAIATHESGDHYGNLDSGPAIGLMQIERSVWDNQVLRAYNFDTNSWEETNVTIEKLRDLEYNVKVGCMIFQQSLNYMNYNVLAAIQCYNMGYGNMCFRILDSYCADEGKTIDQVLENQYDTGWMNYRSLGIGGDENYIENVLSYYGTYCDLQCIKPDGTVVNVTVDNNYAEKIY